MSTAPVLESRVGRVRLILGPMFAGKTTELKRRAERLLRGGRARVCVVKHAHDEARSGRGLVTHDGHRHGPDTTLLAATLSEVKLPEGTTHAMVDEGQFFADLSARVLAWVAAGVEVTVAALNADANAHLWPEVAKLLPYDPAPTFLSSVCARCGADASLTRLRPGSDPLPDAGVRVGAQNDYTVHCTACDLVA